MSFVTLSNGKRFTDPAALQQHLKENPGTSTPEREESVMFTGRAGETPECVGRVLRGLEEAVAEAMAQVTHQWIGQTPVTPGPVLQSRPVTPTRGAFQSPLASREGTPSRPVSALRLGSADPVLWQSPTTPGPDVPPSPSRTAYAPSSPVQVMRFFPFQSDYRPTSPVCHPLGTKCDYCGDNAWSPSSPMQTMRPSPSAAPLHYYAPKTPGVPHSVTATVEPWAGLPSHEVSHIVSRDPSPEPAAFTQPQEPVKLGVYDNQHKAQRRSARLAKRK